MCTSSPESQLHPGLHQKKCRQQVKGGDSAPLLCLCEIPPGVWHPTMGPSAQNRHGPARAGPEEGLENVQKVGTLLCKKAERAGVV